ncbi:hypothetical protein FA95DRAFT_1566630 [Auriscalpium vulgare]|uniref:Uncharacterized protein n=1 Tax=Auriscalpium vulgare TaxID=40419 RepID=A0ACB8R898_9AGAM|nr:hypothetical protein FA95DRAFT_1566630 [Auriscalpium vulgare]
MPKLSSATSVSPHRYRRLEVYCSATPAIYIMFIGGGKSIMALSSRYQPHGTSSAPR